jgi:hypothetical protein
VTGVAVAAPQDRPQADEPRQLPPQLDRPTEARPEKVDQPATWSRDDLQQRLEHLSPAHPSSLADKPERNFWTEVPRFKDALADHLRRWPEDQRDTTVDRSQDPEGSWRGADNRYLSPEQHVQAEDVIAGVREAEERLTEDLTATERDNICGGSLVGLEFRLKEEDRLKWKLAGALRIAPMKTSEAVIKEVPDAIRYTFCFESEVYTDGYWDIKQRLEARGHQMIYSRNHWRDDPYYKGINTRWITEDGVHFEVQFHSEESFHAKQELTHGSYERIRSRLIDRSERLELEAYQREICGWIAEPSEVASIPDHGRRD